MATSRCGAVRNFGRPKIGRRYAFLSVGQKQKREASMTAPRFSRLPAAGNGPPASRRPSDAPYTPPSAVDLQTHDTHPSLTYTAPPCASHLQTHTRRSVTRRHPAPYTKFTCRTHTRAAKRYKHPKPARFCILTFHRSSPRLLPRLNAPLHLCLTWLIALAPPDPAHPCACSPPVRSNRYEQRACQVFGWQVIF